MGLDSSSLYLPAPTETDSVIAPTELGTELSRNDEQSIYSLPSDGTPVTITTRKTRAKNTQPGASVLIEYFENGSAVSDATDRKPSVRVRLTSSKLAHGDHAGPSQTRSRASRRRSELEDIEDALMSPYASATEESTVSRNPVDPDHDRIVTYKQRSGKRPVSPLIPEPRMSNPPSSGLPPNAATGSDLSVIPTNSFLDDSGNSVYGENKRSASPLTKTRGQKPRQGERERIRLADKPIEKEKERERRSKSKSSRSRTSSLSAVQKEREREREKARESDLNYEGYSHISHRDSIGHSSKSRTRRSSRGQGQESFVSGADSVISSTVSRAPEAQSTRSSDVNSKLLAAVEVALRRVVIPELEAIKRETSKRESRRASGGSSITSASHDEVSVSTHHRRRSSQSRHRLPGDRDRERDRDRARERERVMSPESVDDYYAETPKRSPDQQHNRSNLSSAIAASTAMASAVSGRLKSPPPPEEKKSRRRRRDVPRKRVSDRYDDEFDDESVAPQPPMPLMSEINPSELTRLSLRTADDDRPASAMEEVTKSEVSDGGALLQPVVKEIKLGMQYANISHGDLRALPRGNKETEPPNNEIPSAFPQEYEPNEYGQKVPTRTRQEPTEELYDDPEPQLQTEHHYERDDYDNFYGQQDVPAHLKYVPYQPERRGLSPIYSVSGYTENSELAARESHIASNSEDYQSPPMSPRHNRRSSLISSNILNSDGLPHSEISSVAGYPRNPTYTDDLSELDVEPDQPVRGIGVNPKIMPGAPIESVVASLIDGSLMEQSVMTSATNAYPYYGPDSTVSYGVARSVVSYGPDSVVSSEDPKHVIRELTIKKKQSDVVMHDVSMVQEEFEDPEDADRSITPTAVEQAAFAAITSGALARVVQAKQIQINATPKDDVIPGGGAGVARNKSFKQRTMEGHEIATTPAHSVDRFYGDDQEPKLSSSALPDLDDPMPEYGDNLDLGSDITASILEQHLGVKHDIFDRGQEELSFIAGADDAISVAPTRDMSELDEVDEGNLTPRALSPKKSTVNADSNMTGADSTVGAHTQNPNGDHDDDATRTSAERKRETILTNPYENISPLASNRLSETFGFADQGHLPKDEGYVSNGPNRTPDNFNLDDPKEVSMPSAPAFGGVDDSFFTGRMSGLTPGPETPLYDPGMTSGGGSIHNKDIMTLMQDLVARDAQRNARDTEIAAMVMFLANEMRTHFQTVEDRIKQAEDVIIDEVQDSEKMVIKAINGPRPYPGPSSAPRSIGGTATANSSNAGPEMTMAAKKGNILRRALNGLNVTGAKDLSRIEVMLHQLLEEVMELKDHQVQPQPQAGSTFENLGGDSGENDTIDGGYDPEGRAGTSIASHGSQSMSTSRISTSRSAHFDRKYSDHRVSTVHEGDEEEALDTTYDAPHDDRASTPVLNQETGPRGESIVMATPSREPAIPAAFAQTSAAALPTASPLAPENESSPKSAGKSEKSRKHKSTGSSGFGARISRWSETTASTLSKAFRSSGGSSKKNEPYMQNPDSGSRSGSDFAGYNDNSYRPRTAPYSNDKLHTGFSDQNLDRTPSPGASATPLMPSYMNPEHPKYHVHRNSLNLQHPQPRQGNSERFKNNLESQARIYDTTNTPRSADWGHSVSSLNSLQPANAHGMAEASLPPPRPPKEAIGSSTPRSNRIAKNAAHSSPSYEAQHHQYAPAADSPRTRDVDRLAGMPTRRPSGPRAMTPKTPNDESYEERRRNRNTFGSVASRASADTDTF
ncbi:hypothetical protein BROUX41_003761 [Berkeleyomyces rouxiae]|uniref:uncharacterized protein n=1 Tax=Berkeleyomyces rouxiae TaxID=2035830 RepID=UPI003B7F05F0